MKTLVAALVGIDRLHLILVTDRRGRHFQVTVLLDARLLAFRRRARLFLLVAHHDELSGKRALGLVYRAFFDTLEFVESPPSFLESLLQ